MPKEKTPHEEHEKAPRSYYYDDAHGYEEFDPNDDGSDEPSGGGALDVDADRSPSLLVETDHAQEKARKVPCQDS